MQHPCRNPQASKTVGAALSRRLVRSSPTACAEHLLHYCCKRSAAWMLQQWILATRPADGQLAKWVC